MKNFSGKVVLVTGAGSGIGRETAKLFAEKGAHLIVTDVNEVGGRETVKSIKSSGGSAEFHRCDVAKPKSVESLAGKVSKTHGAVDVLVNNAGIGAAGSFLNSTLDTWNRVIDVNLKGVIHGCHYFLPQMVERGEGGHVVNLASAAAFVSPREMPAYGTSKAAVLGFSEILRMDMAQYGIGVTAVCPGIINTPIVANTVVETDTGNAEKFLDNAVNAYRRRNYPPSKVARAIVRAVQKNTAVCPVSPEAWVMYYGKRLAPSFWQLVGRSNISGI